MFAWSLADGRLFVDTVQDLVLRLDFVEPGEPLRLSPALPAVRHLLLDVRAYAHRGGEDGVRFCELAGRLVDDLELVVRDHDVGNRSAWAARRGGLIDICSQLERLLEQSQSDPALPAGRVVPVRSDLSEATVGVKGEKVEKVEKVRAALPPLSRHSARILALLLEHGATNCEDRVTRGYVLDELGLSDAVCRAAIERQLRVHGFVESKVGRDGGMWLSASGIEAANTLDGK